MKKIKLNVSIKEREIDFDATVCAFNGLCSLANINGQKLHQPTLYLFARLIGL